MDVAARADAAVAWYFLALDPELRGKNEGYFQTRNYVGRVQAGLEYLEHTSEHPGSSIQVFTTLPQNQQVALDTKDAYPDAGHRPHSCKP